MLRRYRKYVKYSTTLAALVVAVLGVVYVYAQHTKNRDHQYIRRIKEASKTIPAINRYDETSASSNPRQSLQMLAMDFEGEPVPEISEKLGEILDQYDIRDVLVPLSNILDVDFNSKATATASPKGHKLVKIDVENGAHMRIYREPKYLYYYCSLDEHVPPELTHDDAIPVEQAANKAQALLTALNIKDPLDSSMVTLDDAIDGKFNDLNAASWVFILNRKYMGYVTPSYVNIGISAYTGKVDMFSQSLLQKPVSMEIKLSTEQAIKIAEDFAERRGLAIQSPGGGPIEIVTPNSCWREANEPNLPPDHDHWRLVHRIVFGNKHVPNREHHDLRGNFVFYVDCATGKIVGGLPPMM